MHVQLVNFVYTDASGTVCHWHVSTQTCISKIREARQTLAVAFASDYSTFTTAGTDKRLLVYDEATHQLQATLEARYMHLIVVASTKGGIIIVVKVNEFKRLKKYKLGIAPSASSDILNGNLLQQPYQ